MCGRYGQVDGESTVAETYKATIDQSDPFGLKMGLGQVTMVEDEIEELYRKTLGKEQNIDDPNYNVSPGNFSIMILNNAGDKQLIRAVFGFRPHWGKPTMMSINARSEGDFNKEDDCEYKGERGIFKKPFFREAILQRRCILPVNYFIEGPKEERLSKPYVVMRGDGKSFALAAVWEKYRNKETGQEVIGFAVVTTPANAITKAIGHHRTPLVLHDEEIDKWMNPATTKKELEEMMVPFDASEFFCYRVTPDVKKPNYYGTGNNYANLVQPIETPIFPEGYTGPDPKMTLPDLHFPGGQSSLF